ncbi:hypothetical protein H2199_001376 [Coniosporium tulheliwenetii]|uniref:Uncharacterized protein n=1 Tax=Coniosporium tulheliwenetii TaxID=3383036 RepID=A0ACC2ZM34_9PEZI|nr:hypothetical protein H2199_001376 [Cladosporium sp. JES 115]
MASASHLPFKEPLISLEHIGQEPTTTITIAETITHYVPTTVENVRTSSKTTTSTVMLTVTQTVAENSLTVPESTTASPQERSSTNNAVIDSVFSMCINNVPGIASSPDLAYVLGDCGGRFRGCMQLSLPLSGGTVTVYAVTNGFHESSTFCRIKQYSRTVTFYYFGCDRLIKPIGCSSKANRYLSSFICVYRRVQCPSHVYSIRNAPILLGHIFSDTYSRRY